jgi:hypothetical protein
MTKVLVSDPIDQIGIDIISQVAHVDVRTGLSQDELIGLLGDYDALMIRSGTQVTAPVIEAAPKLMDFLGDSNQASAVDVILYVREIVETYPHLREATMRKLLQSFPTIHSSRVARVALWLVGEYCTEAPTETPSKPIATEASAVRVDRSVGFSSTSLDRVTFSTLRLADTKSFE